MVVHAAVLSSALVTRMIQQFGISHLPGLPLRQWLLSEICDAAIYMPVGVGMGGWIAGSFNRAETGPASSQEGSSDPGPGPKALIPVPSSLLWLGLWSRPIST